MWMCISVNAVSRGILCMERVGGDEEEMMKTLT